MACEGAAECLGTFGSAPPAEVTLPSSTALLDALIPGMRASIHQSGVSVETPPSAALLNLAFLGN